MSNKRYRKQTKFFQALAHPVRLQILAILSKGPICVCDLISETGQRQAYISQQLAILREARLVRTRRLGMGNKTDPIYSRRRVEVTDYIELHRHLESRLTQLGREIPLPMGGFARLRKKAVADGALSAKTKEMMALAISIVVGCQGCIAYHVHDAIQAGATRPELLETLGVALMMGGGPGSIYAAHALDAIEQLLPELNPDNENIRAEACRT